MLSIDLNADLGEGMDTDSMLMPYLSSCNIACGGHAGDESSMKTTVALALQTGTAIGAHPAYPDREGFGRAEWIGSNGDYSTLVSSLYQQISDLQQICQLLGARLQHIKPHGALYNRVAYDQPLATMLLDCIAQYFPDLLLYGLAQSPLQYWAAEAGIRFVPEGFADRRYRPDGTLVPRQQAAALIQDLDEVAAQAIQLIKLKQVRCADNTVLSLAVESICLHGDTPGAVKAAKRLSQRLKQEQITVAAPTFLTSQSKK